MPPEGTLLVIWLSERMRRFDDEDEGAPLGVLALLRADMAKLMALRGFSLVPFAVLAVELVGL
jgi:hypothetical protein